MYNNCFYPSLTIAYPREGQIYSNITEAYGLATPCACVRIRYNGSVYSTRASVDGYWRIPLSSVDCGNYTLIARTCVCCERATASVNFTLRRYIGAPVVTAPTAGSTVTDNPFEVTGTANPNYVVRIRIGDAAPISVVADSTGNFTSPIARPATDGDYTIIVTQEPPFNTGCTSLPTSIPITVATPTA